MFKNILGKISLVVTCATVVAIGIGFQGHGMLLLWQVGAPYWLNYLIAFLLPFLLILLLFILLSLFKKLAEQNSVCLSDKPMAGTNVIAIGFMIAYTICTFFAIANILNLIESGERIEASKGMIERIGLPRAKNLVNRYDQNSLTGKTMLLSSWNASLPFVELNKDHSANLMLGGVYYPSLATDMTMLRAPKSIVVSSTEKIEWSWKKMNDGEQICLNAECFDINPENGVLTLQGKPAFKIAQVDDTVVHWNVIRNTDPKEQSTELVGNHPGQPVTALFY